MARASCPWTPKCNVVCYDIRDPKRLRRLMSLAIIFDMGGMGKQQLARGWASKATHNVSGLVAMYGRKSTMPGRMAGPRLMTPCGEPGQDSVFYCTLKPIDRVRTPRASRRVEDSPTCGDLENALRDTVNLKEDQVLIVDLGGNEGWRTEPSAPSSGSCALWAAAVPGQWLPERESGMVVI